MLHRRRQAHEFDRGAHDTTNIMIFRRKLSGTLSLMAHNECLRVQYSIRADLDKSTGHVE
jgi:hypothetical protein